MERSTFARLGGLTLFVTLALVAGVITTWAAPDAPTGVTPPKWVVGLPAKGCSWSASDRNCHQSSPVVADINGDGRRDIIVATNNGHVVAVSNGAILWDRDVAGSFGMAAGRQSFASSPAVGDLNGDGKPEIVVAAGAISSDCIPGGVLVLDNEGRVKSGWPRIADDEKVPPGGCPDPFFSTPALGDLDGDGDLEIVIGGFDARIYAWHHNGTLVGGFPPPSALYARFGWENIRTRLADTIWSSPALADVDGDGALDIVLGTDEGNFDSRYPGDANGWTCPYRLPPGWSPGTCGGTVYALRGNGQLLPGFPVYNLEVFQSSPALVDLNDDGRAEIFIGTGTFYHDNSPDHPTYGRRMFGLNGQGQHLSGWNGGLPVNELLPGSPAIGDIAGDGNPEIVIATVKGELYAWHHNGVRVGGFPMTPRSPFGDADSHNVGKGVTLGDYDGDGKMEIFMTVGWSVAVIDGDGRMLTRTSLNDESKPFYYAEGLLLNNPVVADIDGDGQLELIAHNSKLYVWDLPNGAVRADWPMFRRDAARTGALIVPRLTISPATLEVGHVAGTDTTIRSAITLRVPSTAFAWRVSTEGNGVNAPNNSGNATGAVEVPIEIRVPASLGPGTHTLGKVRVEVTGNGTDIRNNRGEVSVAVRVVRLSATNLLPVIVDR